jgi:hypothetical protein
MMPITAKAVTTSLHAISTCSRRIVLIPPSLAHQPWIYILYSSPPQRLNRTGGLVSRHHPVLSTPALATVDATPSLTAGVRTNRGSSHYLAMGPATGPRSSRRAGQHVTAERWRQQAAYQRSPRTSARLACAPCASPPRTWTYPHTGGEGSPRLRAAAAAQQPLHPARMFH